jgi:purine-binding chemotaxis protein CheW
MHVTTADEGSPHEAAAQLETQGDSARWVVFTLDTARYALPLHAVERIVRAAQITPLPFAPAVVLGAIDIAGDVFPVFDLRRRLRLRERALAPSDHFVLAHTRERTVVLVIDQPVGVIERPAEQFVESHRVMPTPEGLVLIQDLDAFLSADESSALELAMLHQESSHAG